MGAAGWEPLARRRGPLLPEVSRETSVLVLCLAHTVRFGLPCVRKNPTFGNRPPRFPASGKLRPGASPPEIATAASCDGETRRRIAKSRIFPHMGRRERDGADASDRCTDRKKGGVWNAIWRITLWRVLPPRFRAVFTRMVRFRGSEGGVGRRGAGRPGETFAIGKAWARIRNRWARTAHGRRARRPRGAARSPGRPLVFARILPETPLPRARDVRQCPGFVDIGWAIACGKWVRSRWRKWQRRRGTAMLRAVSCALSQAASAGASRARAPSCS